LAEHPEEGWTGPFRSIICNDERQFNAPGVRVPMLSLSRLVPREHPEWPFSVYHSSLYTPGAMSVDALQNSVKLVLRMVDTLEQNRTPRNEFRGEVFCSRYGIHPDFYAHPQEHRAFFDVLYLIDGTRSLAEIARETGASFQTVNRVVTKLEQLGLCSSVARAA